MPLETSSIDRIDRLTGVLLGTAVGDALGLPREGVSRRRAARLFDDGKTEGKLRHRFLLGRGMISDDTEHACMAAQALLAAPDDEARFARSLAFRLRGWLIGLPPAVGWGTLRSILKLWVGFSPAKSGVSSAGNGAAMRAPILGACLAYTPDRLEPMLQASTRLTHRDHRAEEGALILALAAAHAARRAREEVRPEALFAELRARRWSDDLRRVLDDTESALAGGDSVEAFAEARGLGDGVSGFILDTVPAALFCWLRSPGDVRRAVEEVIRMGGDADSTGAIVGGLAGATAGASGVPDEWLSGILDWPRSVTWMRHLGARLACSFPASPTAPSALTGPLPLFWPAIPLRNLVLLFVALMHGFRRMLPPY